LERYNIHTIEQDTLMRDNNYQSLGYWSGSKTQL